MALGLIDLNLPSETAYSSLIQNFNRFILEQISTDSAIMPGNPRLYRGPPMTPTPGRVIPTVVSQVVGLEAKTLNTCSCGAQTARDSTANVIELLYPRKVCSYHDAL